MRDKRFQAEQLEDDVITLDAAQSHHAVNVLRLGAGDSVTLFDGSGREADGRILEAAPQRLRVQVTHRRESFTDRGGLTLVVAMPKGERADWMVEKCAELGVQSLVPLLCERGQVAPGDGKLARWRRKSGEAAKQSRQSLILRLDAPRLLTDAIQAVQSCDVTWYGDPQAESIRSAMGTITRNSTIAIFIGPEGGFAPHEMSALEQAGARPVRWSNTILRIETAAVAAASVWAALRAGAAGE